VIAEKSGRLRSSELAVKAREFPSVGHSNGKKGQKRSKKAVTPGLPNRNSLLHSPPANAGGAWILTPSFIERGLRGLPASSAYA
jgi:hypothetical protein